MPPTRARVEDAFKTKYGTDAAHDERAADERADDSQLSPAQ